MSQQRNIRDIATQKRRERKELKPEDSTLSSSSKGIPSAIFPQAILSLDVEDLLYTRTVRMEAKARKSHSPAHFGQREKGAYLHN